MTALSESFYLMSIHNIFSWLISTLLLFSRIGKPVLDTGPKRRQFGRRRNDGLPTEWLEDGTWHKKAISTLFRWAGIQGYPWRISESNIAHAFTLICNEYFGHSAEYDTITSNCKVVCIVSVLHLPS